MRLFRWPWPLILPAPYCFPIWKVKSLQRASACAAVSDGEGSLIDARKGIGSGCEDLPLEGVSCFHSSVC